MKRQYLGDSKDSFKWDYLHALAVALKYRCLRIAWMLTEDDPGTDGRTAPERFPARPEILALCREMRSARDPALVANLPAALRASYSVAFHEPERCFSANGRREYFAAVRPAAREVLFFDPDNGFEPERRCTEKHLEYAELGEILRRAPDDFVAVVFQHHRRRHFAGDFARIRARLAPAMPATAIYWQTLMFVAVSPSARTLDNVRTANAAYARHKPIVLLI